jgi:hypothetical protein
MRRRSSDRRRVIILDYEYIGETTQHRSEIRGTRRGDDAPERVLGAGVTITAAIPLFRAVTSESG